MRFTLLFASTALAASLVLSACSSGGTSSAIPGGNSIAPMGQNHGGYRLVTEVSRDTSCPSTFVQCLALTPGSPAEVEWCISSSGNCTSGLYDGRIKWLVTRPGVLKIKTGKPYHKIKAAWSAKKGNPDDLTVTPAAGVRSTKGTIGYEFQWTATLLSGSYKGSVFTEEEGLSVL
ncbi:MAG: hypothetical protein WAL67_08025 [Candidatus Cybelea sp.]